MNSSNSVARTLTSKNPRLLLLETCSNLTHLKSIYTYMIKTSLIDDTFAVSRIFSFFTKLEPAPTSLDYAERIFAQVQNPNLFIYNAMIRIYSNSSNPQKSIHLFIQLKHQNLIPDNLTFPFLVKSCSQVGSLDMGKEIHCQIVRYGLENDIYVRNSLVHMYATCGDIDSANVIFQGISQLDIVSWTSMIAGYNRYGDVQSARQLFDRMPQRNIVTWSIMIVGYARNGHFHKALDLFGVMQSENVLANETVMATVIASCAHLGALEQGERAHDYVLRNNLSVTMILGTALVDMYARFGNIHKAMQVFEELPQRDVLSWTAIIGALAMHGHAESSLSYFAEMLKTGLEPRDITFTAVLSACSHAGLVERGFKLFESMRKDYGIEPSLEHYGCMVDLLGRAGLLDEAERFILEMPTKPNAPIWGALLGACQIHKNTQIGERVGKILIKLQPGHSGYYVLLSNIYARAGRWQEVTDLRQVMKERGVKKSPGYSLIEIDGRIHSFFLGDRSHPEIEKIEAMWDEIVRTIRDAGYAGNTAVLLLYG